jgi:hypothetical protein
MKKIITMVVAFGLMGLSAGAQGPNWAWVKCSTGNGGSDYSTGVTTDALGNAYVVGNFGSSNISFSTFNLNNNGTNNIFLVKYDVNGNVIWAKSAGGTGIDVANSISIDSFNNIYIVGRYTSSAIAFGSHTLVNLNGWNNIFIAKYDSGGNAIWAKGIYGGLDPIAASSITVDNSGNIYFTGYSQNTTTVFETINLSIHNGYMFMAKYDSSGTVKWAKNAGMNLVDWLSGITTDSKCNVYITGGFLDDTLKLDSLSFINSNMDSTTFDIFLAKYDSSGNILWARSDGGNKSSDANSVACDNSDNVYITGNYKGDTLLFGSTILVNTNNDSSSMFLAKYDSSGSVLWAKCAGGVNNNYGETIKTDINKNVIVGGVFSCPSISFGSTILNNFYSSGNNDALFVVKYDSSGDVLWAKTAYGIGSVWSLTIDTINDIYITGQFSSDTISFGAINLMNDSTSLSSSSMYLAKINATTGINEIKNNTHSLSLYPNPTTSLLTLSLPNTNQKVSINLYDMMGQKQLTIDNGQLTSAMDNGQLTIDNNTTTMSIVNYQLSIEKLPQGIYFLEVLMDGEKQVRKVVKIN